MSKTPKIPKIPADFLLEKLKLNELSPSQRASINQSMSREEQLKAIETLKKSDQEIFNQYSTESIVKNIENQLDLSSPRGKTLKTPRKYSWLRGWSVGAAIAAACLVTLVVLVPRMNYKSDEILIKGLDPQLKVYVKQADSFRSLQTDEKVDAGETIQLRYIAADKRFGVIFSLDGRGTITQHFPSNGNAAAELKKSGEIALDHAYKLDDAPSFERFFFVTSEKVFNVELVKTALNELSKKESIAAEAARLDLPQQLTQTSINLKK